MKLAGFTHLATAMAMTIPFTKAILSPAVPGMALVWQDTFTGCAGCQPSNADWNIMTGVHTNNEIQNYTASVTNLQLSGGQTLQIIPWLSDEGQWTSARIESTRSWTPQPGKAMQFQSYFRTGTNDINFKKGMWPAFWLLGDVLRHGTPWPLCGELDIFEQVNGLTTGYGTAHCIQKEGGPCNEPSGLGKAIDIPDNEFHTWTLKIDRTSNDWATETIQWFRDGILYHTLIGSDFSDPGVWATLAHSPMYMILNVAVGGNWPGNPDGATANGYGNMMEVEYVAVYETI